MAPPPAAAVPPVKLVSATQTLEEVSVYRGPPAFTRQVDCTTGVKVLVAVGVTVGVLVGPQPTEATWYMAVKRGWVEPL